MQNYLQYGRMDLVVSHRSIVSLGFSSDLISSLNLLNQREAVKPECEVISTLLVVCARQLELRYFKSNPDVKLTGIIFR